MDVMRWKQAFLDGRLPHAVLIAGVEGSGKKTFARLAAAWFLLGNDDVGALAGCPFLLEAGSMAAEDVRRLAQELMNETYARGRRVLLLPDAHRMNEQAQNALLHTIEEPPEDALVLLTGNEMGILPTIRSRCMTLRLGAKPESEIAGRLVKAGVEPAAAARAAHLSGGVYGAAERYAAEAFGVFADEAERLLLRLLAHDPCYAEMAQLITRREDGADGKKKTRVSADALGDLCDVLLSHLTDAAHASVGAARSGAIGQKIAAGFTLAQIQGMIGVVLDAKRSLAFRAAPQQTLDAMLARISLILE